MGVTIKRFLRRATFGGGERHAQSRAVRTWAAAEALLREWADDPKTADNFSNTLLIRARWKNGLCMHEVGLSAAIGRNPGRGPLADFLHEILVRDYGPGKRRLTSVKAAMAREVLARCSFTDDTALDGGEDARAFDAAKRSLEQCYPDHAAVYVERIKTWMLSGGGVR